MAKSADEASDCASRDLMAMDDEMDRAYRAARILLVGEERSVYPTHAACPRRYGDRIKPVIAAVHESESGTFETCRRALGMSGVGGRPEVISRCSKRRF
jgi:hypothetical protein